MCIRDRSRANKTRIELVCRGQPYLVGPYIGGTVAAVFWMTVNYVRYNYDDNYRQRDDDDVVDDDDNVVRHDRSPRDVAVIASHHDDDQRE